MTELATLEVCACPMLHLHVQGVINFMYVPQGVINYTCMFHVDSLQAALDNVTFRQIECNTNIAHICAYMHTGIIL